MTEDGMDYADDDTEYIDASPILVGMAMEGLARGLTLPFETHWPGNPDSKWRINAFAQETKPDGAIVMKVNANYLGVIECLVLETTIGPAGEVEP